MARRNLPGHSSSSSQPFHSLLEDRSTNSFECKKAGSCADVVDSQQQLEPMQHGQNLHVSSTASPPLPANDLNILEKKGRKRSRLSEAKDASAASAATLSSTVAVMAKPRAPSLARRVVARIPLYETMMEDILFGHTGLSVSRVTHFWFL